MERKNIIALAFFVGMMVYILGLTVMNIGMVFK
jgi:hypothetical protein